jgi:hypothetical protein
MAVTLNASTTAGLVQTADTSGLLALQTAGTTAVTVDASQNVGIGTASPNQKLRIENNANSSTWSNIANSSAGNGAGSGVLFATDQGDAGALFQNSSGNGTANALRLRNLLNAPILLEINGTERARFNTTGALVFAGGTTSADGIGITFPATQSASSNANTLDDYEEGTWTPVLTFGTTIQTITIPQATYVKVGKSVTINMQITFPAKVSSGRVFITGLPFAKETGGTVPLLAGCPAGSVTTLAAIFYNVDGAGTTLNLAEQAGDINSASLAASGALFCSGTYFV